MRKLALILLAFGCALQAVAQTPTPTTIVGPVFDSVGNAYTGSFTVQSQAKTAYGFAITGTVRTIYVNAGVIQSFTLVPNDSSTPNLTSYAVTYANSDRWLCIVPTVASPVATTATTVATNATITVASGAGIVTGQLVSGVGIPANTTVLSVSGTSIGLSAAPTGSATVAITFYTTVGFAQICTPNATPPNVNTPLPPAQILPSQHQGWVLTTVGGVSQWAPPATVVTLPTTAGGYTLCVTGTAPNLTYAYATSCPGNPLNLSSLNNAQLASLTNGQLSSLTN